MWVNLDISKSSLWVWNYLTWLWLFCFISRLCRDIYLNWVAAEILKVAAGNFAVRFTTQLIACPFKTDSFHTTSHLPQHHNQSLQTPVHLHTWIGPWGSFSLAITLLTINLLHDEGHTAYTYSYSVLWDPFHQALMSYCMYDVWDSGCTSC